MAKDKKNESRTWSRNAPETVEIGCMDPSHTVVPHYYTVKRGEVARCPDCGRVN